MNLSLKELNDLYYCVGSLRLRENKLLSNEVLDELSNKIMRNKKINKYNDVFQDDSKIAPKELHFEFIFLLEYYSHAF